MFQGRLWTDPGWWQVPVGYSTKYWDGKERPLFLLGSVFDANSLGKWIFDWTVFRFGAGSPMAGLSGELWQYLLRWTIKAKRAEEAMGRVRGVEERQILEDFIRGAERMWLKWTGLMEQCECRMLNGPLEEGKGEVTLGAEGGIAFVDTIFGRDRELENTERWMHGARLWSERFDANCRGIL